MTPVAFCPGAAVAVPTVKLDCAEAAEASTKKMVNSNTLLQYFISPKSISLWKGIVPDQGVEQTCLRFTTRSEGAGSGISEIEVEDVISFAGLARRCELPALRRLAGKPGEIPARSGRVELSCHHVTLRIHIHPYRYSHGSFNGVAGAVGHVGQDLTNNSGRRAVVS